MQYVSQLPCHGCVVIASIGCDYGCQLHRPAFKARSIRAKAPAICQNHERGQVRYRAPQWRAYSSSFEPNLVPIKTKTFLNSGTELSVCLIQFVCIILYGGEQIKTEQVYLQYRSLIFNNASFITSRPSVCLALHLLCPLSAAAATHYIPGIVK